MPDLIPWWQMLPQAQSPEQTINAQLLAEKLAQSRQQTIGYNAIGQLFSNPANLQNGMLKPEALSQAIGAGAVPPQVGLSVMGAQSELQERQALMRQREASMQNTALK